MTEEFIEWFNEHVKETMFVGCEEERENLMAFCWLAWRDARRRMKDDIRKIINSEHK